MPYFQHCFPSPQKMARFLAKIAVRSLYDELALYPKPGLVSFVDSGAHHDMDGALFFRSLFCLRHYFFQVGLAAGYSAPPLVLVHHGQAAEERMHAVTKGVNTHRGAIFALGIFCSSVCKLGAHYSSFSMDDLHKAIISDWAYFLEQHHPTHDTHGAKVKKQYGVPCAKQIAIEGYSLIFALYQELLEEQLLHDKFMFGLVAYQRLLLVLNDINVLYRTGPEGLTLARQLVSEWRLHDRKSATFDAQRLHKLFSQHNISPGGVADMLSVLYFLHHLFAPKP